MSKRLDNLVMKFLFDLFPIILFFIAFKFSDIYTATIVAMVATIAQILWVYYRHRKIDAMQWVSLAMIVVFGSLTIFLHDKTFIQLKPTALYWLFSATLLISALFFNKNWIAVLMGKQVTLKSQSAKTVWHRLNLAWSAFFFVMGALNLYIAFQYSEETWVNFKLFGSTGLLIIFIIIQGVWLARHMEHPDQ
jgi:intracellular septation protein